MKHLLAISAALLLSFHMSAQDIITPPKKQGVSLVAGVVGDIHLSTGAYRYTDTRFSMGSIGGAAFVRKYLGGHLALELEANKNMSEKTFVSTYNYSGQFYNTTSYTVNSLDLPLHVQYHFNKKTERLRPFVGIGLGVSFINSNTGWETYYTGSRQDVVFREKDFSGILQITEGISYRVNDKLQMNQALYYKATPANAGNNFGLRFGVGYIIR